LKVGGHLIVSEPPDSEGLRWASKSLLELGLEVGRIVKCGGAGYQVLTKTRETPKEYPRANGIPGKKLLF
jgi:hypothetical protein